MRELQQILDLQKGDTLLTSLMHAGYAFAAWRMPKKEEVTFIVSLKEVQKQEGITLSAADPGFLVNAFSDNHPIKPYHIAADIIITSQGEVTLSPKVTSTEIDDFKARLAENVTARALKSTESVPFNNYEQIVANAVEEIKNGSFEKIVLSRFRDEVLPNDFSAWEFFGEVAKAYANAFCSLTYIPGKGLWIGATPELLLSDSNERFMTVALAGTKRLEDDQPLSEIAWTQKEIEEQVLVSRYIINCFKKIRLREFHEHGPKTIQAGNLAHLKTEFIVDYTELVFEDLADQMLELLHPTSAVCGMPIELVKPWIVDNEKYDREFYAGFIGPVNFDGATNLFVNLRCIKVENETIRFFAGAGITEDSNPKKEYVETEMKIDVLKRIFK
ncbi:MAG: chorismate-binding protein [Ekhidna sp.]|uniref:chorismate-binding protein n=1 Tax=Ekhidna sp. TaxID=2608089 RepID=UPI0032EE38DA